MSPEYQDKIKNWNKLDTALYEHFNALLDEKIKAFGKEKMQAEIEELNGKNCWPFSLLINNFLQKRLNSSTRNASNDIRNLMPNHGFLALF